MFSRGYAALLSRPVWLLLALAVAIGVAATRVPSFAFDASADTLVSRNDPDLRFYATVNESFGAEEFLFLTYAPADGEVLGQRSLDAIAALQAELTALEGVRSVFSVLDAPLLKSPPMSLIQLASGGLRTLESPEADRAMALEELTNSPIFADLLVSSDGGSTALRIDLAPDPVHDRLLAEREALRDARDAGQAFDAARLAAVEADYALARARFLAEREALLSEIRAIRDRYREGATAYLGGVPMVASDMIGFVKSDIAVFGALVLGVIMVALWGFFRRPRWVLVPLLTAVGAIVLTVGTLSAMGQAATVISSNFIALLAILTISFSIHLVVRYRELFGERPGAAHLDLVVETQLSKFAPILYTALTTLVAFASLVSSDIVPVIDFGWIMCVGILFAFAASVLLFPAVLALLPRGEAARGAGESPALTRFAARVATGASGSVLLAAGVVAVLAAIGIGRLSLDNRFIDYFRSGTEIREGMVYIDRHLGGTVPFDVIVQLDPYGDTGAGGDGEDPFAEEEDPFVDEEDPFAEDEGAAPDFVERYWITTDKLALLGELHDFIAAQPEVGKVLSLASLEKVARDFNDGEPLGPLVLAGVLSVVPAEIRTVMIDPYANARTGQMRISARVIESGPAFSRDELLQRISAFAETEIGLDPGQVRGTGMMVLFNNMLKQLFDSQTSTLLFVVLATLLMFALLLRSIALAVIGLLPNLLAAATVLGVMGWVGIPLDMMTITIAAISIGIGVDNAIHYLHRYRQELAISGSARQAVLRSHDSIGHALYYASFTIIAGFSILAFSNFVPTVYFGLLTALAMAFATLANLVVLPALLLRMAGPAR